MNSRLRYLITLLLCVFLFHPAVSYSQTGREYSTTNRRAIRAFEDALQKYQLLDARGAEESFRDALRFDPEFIEAYIVMAEMFQDLKRHDDAITAIRSAIDIDPGFFPNLFYYLSVSHAALGQYNEAHRSLLAFLQQSRISPQMRERAEKWLINIEFAREAVANPVPFEPINLGPNINTEHDEYAPTLTADSQTLIFTRKKPREDFINIEFGREYEDFYVSVRENDEWSPAVNLGPPINTTNNEGAQSISADGMHLYFTACNRPGGMGSCDIYYARRVGNAWSEPVNLGPPINSASWESQPSISPDGRTLYFTSNRRGNLGRMDIWVSQQTSPGRWAEPENIGPVINTTGREMSPFIHPDNRTLFFASDGHPGMGGMDLFYTTRNDEGDWQTPVNLGYPINTHADEISLVVSASGREAYFASEQPGGYGQSDIYFFELYEEARPTPVTYMTGVVYDLVTSERLEARFQIIDLATGETIVESSSNPGNGEFLVPIPIRTSLALNVWKNGYLFFSENFSFEDDRTTADPHFYDIPLQPIREGESVVLRNIFFRIDSHELLPESMTELKKLLELLQENPGLRIEISGHTDNTGSFAHNKNLSERRAMSVFEFLVENGIDKQRLTAVGYADQMPIASNDTEEGRALNRRTEFKVLGNTLK